MSPQAGSQVDTRPDQLSPAGRRPRIMVTNDDGIDSVGLHVLARELVGLGEVFIAAPDQEYSGAGTSIGALYLIRPEVHRVQVPSAPGIDAAWSVTGPPALCVMFARLGAFGAPPDVVVSGINPGANVGRAVYHSGTIGAAVTARIGGIHGVAISQEVADGSFDGQAALTEALLRQEWQAAATVTRTVVEGLLADPPAEAVALNINVPNCPVSDMKGWRRTEIGNVPARTLATSSLEPKPGHDNAFRVAFEWGEARVLPEHLDGGAVSAGYVSICDLSRIAAMPEPPSVGNALSALLPHRPHQ
jgi:5'-nucleotidase